MKAFLSMIAIGVIIFLISGCIGCSKKPDAPVRQSLYEKDGVLTIHRKAYYELIKKGVPPETAARQAPELYALCQSTGGGASCYSN